MNCASEDTKKPTCANCGNTKVLTQSGILRVYVRPHPLCAVFIPVGILLGLFRAPAAFALTIAGIVWPVANADFRLALYPVVALGKLCGKLPACPDCEGSGRLFVLPEELDHGANA